MRISIIIILIALFSKTQATDYWQPYKITAEVITYNNIDRKVKFSVYDSLSGIWRYYNTPYYNTPKITITDTLNTIIGFNIYEYDNNGNIVRDTDFGFVIFDHEIHQFKPYYDYFIPSIPSLVAGADLEPDGIAMSAWANEQSSLGYTWIKEYTMMYSIIKHKWDTLFLEQGVRDAWECYYSKYVNSGFAFTCEHFSSSDKNYRTSVLMPVEQTMWHSQSGFIGSYVTSGRDMTFKNHNGVYDTDAFCHAFDPVYGIKPHSFGGGVSSVYLHNNILRASKYTLIYDDSTHSMVIDSLPATGTTGVIIKDGVVTFKHMATVVCKAFSPTTRTWISGTFPSTGIDSLKIVNGTVKWKDAAGNSHKAGYIDGIGWGNYETPLLLSFYASELYSASGYPYVFVRNYSIGTDSVRYDFGDGVISEYYENSLWHLYQVNGHYQPTYPNVNYNICIQTVNDSGLQSHCQSFSINCVEADIPIIDASSDSICASDPVTLSITGNLNSAQKWSWYTGSCNGISIGTGDTIIVNPGVTTTYYAIGEGGCIVGSGCGSVTINVGPPPQATIAPSGPTTFCQGDSVVLLANSGIGLSYQWLHYHTIIPGATNPSLTVYTAGPYNLTVKENGCAKTSLDMNISVPCLPPFDPSEKNSEYLTETFDCWFSDNTLHVAAKIASGNKWEIQVYNMIGSLLFSESGTVITPEHGPANVNFSRFLNIAPGTYFVKLKSNGSQFSGKILKL
ncbi:MAG: T9SS type A sorting domain-containing protein [Bacteroidia bacterium]|nr:T9SS type A sorting domain-containing protein [Bacteroidia bacterium]